MKLFRILPLVVCSAAASIFANTSPANALDFTYSIIGDQGSGSGSISGTIYGLATTGSSSPTSISIDSSSVPSFILGDYPVSNTRGSFDVSGGMITDSDFTGNNQQNNGNNFLSTQIQFITGSQRNSQSGFAGVVTQMQIGGAMSNSQIHTNNDAQVFFSPAASATVPWEIPGGAAGATIPASLGLLGLGAMKKARKNSIASKTPIANPVTATIS